DRRRLAGAVGPEEAKRLARVNGEVDPPHRLDLPVALGQAVHEHGRWLRAVLAGRPRRGRSAAMGAIREAGGGGAEGFAGHLRGRETQVSSSTIVPSGSPSARIWYSSRRAVTSTSRALATCASLPVRITCTKA